MREMDPSIMKETSFLLDGDKKSLNFPISSVFLHQLQAIPEGYMIPKTLGKVQ